MSAPRRRGHGVHTSDFLWEYLDSDFYANSFAHHMIHGDMGGASYLNPYPIMDANFCNEVGKPLVNVSGQPPYVDTSAPANCSAVDYDSFSSAAAGATSASPEDPCKNGGVCQNYQSQGYTCDCTGTGHSGDHCQIASGGTLDTTFPWFKRSSSDEWFMKKFRPRPHPLPLSLSSPRQLSPQPRAAAAAVDWCCSS